MTKSTVRLVHFTPNPFSQERFVVGAFVETDGQTHFVAREQQWSAGCLRSAEAADVLVRLLPVLQHLETATVPPAAGRMLAIGEPIPLNRKPQIWLRETVFGETIQPKREYRKKRKILGHRWLAAEGVQARFELTFEPKGKLFAAGMERLGLEPLALFAKSGQCCVLLEPLDPTRPQFRHDVEKVARRFRQYRDFFKSSSNYEILPLDELTECAARDATGSRSPTPQDGLAAESLIRLASFVSVVLPGGDEEGSTAAGLEEIDVMCADANDDQEREALVSQLNRYGATQAVA